MIEAFFWGALGASALLVGALIAYVVTPSPRIIAVQSDKTQAHREEGGDDDQKRR